jgi:hypothetical protein
MSLALLPFDSLTQLVITLSIRLHCMRSDVVAAPRTNIEVASSSSLGIEPDNSAFECFQLPLPFLD